MSALQIHRRLAVLLSFMMLTLFGCGGTQSPGPVSSAASPEASSQESTQRLYFSEGRGTVGAGRFPVEGTALDNLADHGFRAVQPLIRGLYSQEKAMTFVSVTWSWAAYHPDSPSVGGRDEKLLGRENDWQSVQSALQENPGLEKFGLRAAFHVHAISDHLSDSVPYELQKARLEVRNKDSSLVQSSIDVRKSLHLFREPSGMFGLRLDPEMQATIERIVSEHEKGSYNLALHLEGKDARGQTHSTAIVHPGQALLNLLNVASSSEICMVLLQSPEGQKS